MDTGLKQVLDDYEAGNRRGLSPEQLEGILNKNKDSVVLYGAGNAGIEFLKCLRFAGYTPVVFIDTNPNKHNAAIDGVNILYPEETKEKFCSDVLIIVTIYSLGEYKKVCKYLHSLGFNNVMHFIEFRNYASLFELEHNLLPIGVNLNKITSNTESISRAFSVLTDQLSRDIFVSLLRFRLLDFDEAIPALPEAEQYFAYDVYKKIPDEFFVDCGAFDGDTMKVFLSKSDKQFLKYTIFEPDKKNQIKIHKKIEELYPELKEKIMVNPYAVLDRKCYVSFEERGTSHSHITETQGNEIEAVDLDSALTGSKPTFIKMDVEGCEMRALRGAANIIRASKPVLGICSYHKTEDLWDIPLFLKDLNPDYKIYLRSYSGYYEHVCYAVPLDREV